MSRYLLPLLLATACAPQPTHPYPEGFVWGSATAGFQVDMGCPTWDDAACLDTASDWYQWVTDPEIVADTNLFVSGEDVRNGPGMWELFEQDVAQMQADGHSGYRMSLEWSRIFPDAAAADATTVDALEALADVDAMRRYREMFAALRAAEIAPFVTVNHYTLPLWVHDGAACNADLDTCTARGWLDADIIPRIALFAGFCARAFGGEVDRWGTLNEPFATTLSGYLLPSADRSGPPGVRDAEATIATIRHQIEGSAAMYDAIHAEDRVDADGDGVDAEVGLVLNMVAIIPKDTEDPRDLASVEHLDWMYHRQFLDGLTTGAWDDDLDGVWDRERDDLAGRLDFIGINYYNRVEVDGIGIALFPAIPLLDFVPTFSWDPYPEGLAEVVGKAAAYDLPIVITENGTPHLDQADTLLVDHLVSLHAAIDAGADVRGYHYWSWVDNYEWNHGFDLRFGLYALDPDTKARTPRPVRDVLRAAARANGPRVD